MEAKLIADKLIADKLIADKLIADKLNANDFRVVAVDDDGGMEVAFFSGPRAEERAEAFAKAYYGRETT